MANSTVGQDSLVDHTLGHYRLVERIGEGGMGIVYRAHDEHLNRDVAIKILPQGSLADDTSCQRFRKEAHALSKLSHPNVASVFDFDSQGGVAFLVEELIPGTSLDRMLLSGPLPERQIVSLGSQLCQGLASAHEQQIIHRDLKPANLRITPDDRLKILDFGLARVLHAANLVSDAGVTESFTEPQLISGTLPYMAPEQLLNENLDARTDIWSTGCVLYEMATGQRPFAGTGVALADLILHQQPTNPSRLNHKIDPGLEAIILKCLEKDPALRYASVKEIAVDLHRLDTGSVTRALAARRRALLRRAAPVVAVVLLIAGSALWYRIHRQQAVASTGRRVIAVLYFKNLSQDPSLNWLNGGLTEMLTTNLGQVGGMEVLSTEQISLIRKRLKYKPDQELTSEAAPEVAREAGADAYVTGALIRIGPTRLRADVRLQESATGKILFSDKVESSDINGIFAMVDTMTTGVVGGLLPRALRPEEDPQIEQVATSNFEAYRHYQACLDNQDRFSPMEAIRECQEAVRLDPQFALAYLRLVILESKWGSMDKGIAILRQLEPLHSRLPRIRQLQMQAWESILAADYEGAIQRLEVMLREAPRDVETRLLLTATLGRWEPERAVAILREGLALDPKDTGLWNNLTYNESWTGNEAGALEACDRYEALVGPNDPNVWSDRGDVLFFFGRYEEAAAAYLKVRKLKPDFIAYAAASSLANIYSEQGKTASAQRELRRHEQEIKGIDYLLRAQMLQDRGEPEAALPAIQRLIEQDVKDGRPKDAREDLFYFAQYAKNLGEIDSALAFVRRQKIHGKELEMVSLLEAAAGREEDSERALQQFVTANPETPPLAVERARAFSLVLAAVRRGDGAAALKALKGHPGQYMYDRGRAQLLVHDYTAAEYSFRRVIFINRSIRRMPLLQHLAHFRLGEVHEATGRREDAIREYQSFLSHYTKSRSRLPQIAQARAALKRLGA